MCALGKLIRVSNEANQTRSVTSRRRGILEVDDFRGTWVSVEMFSVSLIRSFDELHSCVL